MKMISFFIAFGLWTLAANAQNPVNLKKGYAAQGYDVVAYFNQQALDGDSSFTENYKDAKYRFDTQENLKLFKQNPEKYIPQYGGFCAYAVAKKGKLVSIDPETFLIANGKLYLFYNSWGTNTLEKWNEEGPLDLQKSADNQWSKILEKQ